MPVEFPTGSQAMQIVPILMHYSNFSYTITELENQTEVLASGWGHD